MKTPFLDRGGKTDGRNWREENEVLHSHGASHESAGRDQEYRTEGTAWNILSACFLCAWQGMNGVWGVSSEEVLCVLSEAPVLWQLLFLCFLEGETSVEGSGIVFQCQASCQVSENSS